MKYLEEKNLSWLNSILSCYEIGDRILTGKLEAYSCKKAGADKRLAKSLELQYLQDMSSSISSTDGVLSTSPLGPMTSSSTRKLLINLITTMNASFPDYDFSTVKPEQFCREFNPRLIIHRINHDLSELYHREGHIFVERMWDIITECIKLEECEVYSYIPDMESDPFCDGNLWSFNYFFYNKNMKKILYFMCMAKGRALNYDTHDDDMEMMDDDHEDHDDDGDETVADYFGMSPDWEDGA